MGVINVPIIWATTVPDTSLRTLAKKPLFFTSDLIEVNNKLPFFKGIENLMIEIDSKIRSLLSLYGE